MGLVALMQSPSSFIRSADAVAIPSNPVDNSASTSSQNNNGKSTSSTFETEKKASGSNAPTAPDSETMLNILLSLPEPPISFKSIQTPQQDEMVRKIWNERQEMIKHAMETIENRFKTLTKLSDSIKSLCLAENATQNIENNINHVGDNESEIIMQDLIHLEDLVSGLDDAQDFIKILNGTDLLLGVLAKKSLPEKIRSASAHALGSAIKSFADLQEISRISGTVSTVSLILKEERNSISDEFLSKLLYLLGSQIRNHATSQEEAKVNEGLIAALVDLFHKAIVSDYNALKSSQKKMINFISDIFQQDDPVSPLVPALFTKICDTMKANPQTLVADNETIKYISNRCNVSML